MTIGRFTATPKANKTWYGAQIALKRPISAKCELKVNLQPMYESHRLAIVTKLTHTFPLTVL